MMKQIDQEKLEALLKEFETKLKEVGMTLENAYDKIAQTAEEKLAEGKTEWASLAAKSPNTARRQLRKYWIAFATLTFAVGVIIGKYLF